jgi:hypothetical protein
MTEVQALRVLRAVKKVVANELRRQARVQRNETTKRIAEELYDRDMQDLRKLLREMGDE